MSDRTSRNDSYDVVVIGDGPGGTTAACFLQKQRPPVRPHRTRGLPALHDRRVLDPPLVRHADEARADPKLRESAFTKKFSVRFVSPERTGFGSVLLLRDDRGRRSADVAGRVATRFDLMCRDHVIENGVEVREGVVEHVNFDGDRAVGVRVRSAEGTCELAARVVVDASGRAAVIGNQLDLKERHPLAA